MLLVLRLSLEERRKVGAFRCIGAFFRHVASFSLASSFLTRTFIHTHSLFPFCSFLRVTKKNKNGAGTGPRNWKLGTADPLRTNNVTGVFSTVLADGTVQRSPDQEPNGSYTFFVGPLELGAPCRAWAVQEIRVISASQCSCPEQELPGEEEPCSGLTAARRRAHRSSGRSTLRPGPWRSNGGARSTGRVCRWGLMQNTDWVVCVCGWV